MHLTPSIEFAIVETLWLWTFGPALEALLTRAARANRLNLEKDGRSLDIGARGPFGFWPTQYQRFREDGFVVARRLLAGKDRCLVASLDIAAFYDNVDPRFLVRKDFVSHVRSEAGARDIRFDSSEYVGATRTLLSAFRRYYSACRSVTGLSMRRGIPIGCLSSRVIANLALAPLDDYISNQTDVQYYARYVDDILLVATPQSPIPRTSRRIASRFLPVVPTSARSDEIELDTHQLGRRGSEFRLQQSKLRGYVLRGRRGREFLSVIERDLRQIASERRAFLHPDGLGTESPFSALRVGSDHRAPVQVLRDVDRIKVERYAASVAVSKVGVGAQLLKFPESASWCRDQLAPLVGVITDATHWVDFIDLAFRALGVSIEARDSRTARFILTRHRIQWRRFVTARHPPPLVWNTRHIHRRTARRRLVDWFEGRRLEAICASIPLSVLSSAADTRRFLEDIARKSTMIGDRPLNERDVSSRAFLLARADLRARDRESDHEDTIIGGAAVRSNQGWRRLDSVLRSDEQLAQRLERIDGFLQTCREQRDKPFERLSALEVLLMTRPPTAFDTAYRWAQAGNPLSTLMPTVNALRGTRYDEETIREVDEFTIDITRPSPWVGQRKELNVVLGNLQAGENGPWAAAEGCPEMTRRRVTSLGRVVNSTIERSIRTGVSTLLLLPELSLPRRWLRPLADRLIAENIGLVVGLDYANGLDGVVNEAVGVFPAGFHATAVCRWRKSRPAREEAKELLERGLQFVTGSSASTLVINTDNGALGTLICSELLDVELRGSLLGRIDVLLVPAWNKDTSTFDHTVQTVANDLHCYVAVANNAMFSDCRLQTPSDKRYLRDACRLIWRNEDEVISALIDVDALRLFQQRSLRDAKVNPNGFKPVPPGYKYRRS